MASMVGKLVLITGNLGIGNAAAESLSMIWGQKSHSSAAIMRRQKSSPAFPKGHD